MPHYKLLCWLKETLSWLAVASRNSEPTNLREMYLAALMLQHFGGKKPSFLKNVATSATDSCDINLHLIAL